MPIQCRQLSPKNITIDVLRTAGSKPLPSTILLAIGALFGYSDNAMRVAINRLTNKGILEKSSEQTPSARETALYRLSPATDPLSAFIDNWQLAEKRVKPWQENQWLLCHLPKSPERSIRIRSIKALSLLGFRPGPDNLWIRPDNLSNDFRQLEKQLRQLGLEEQASLLSSHQMATTLCQQWRILWDTPENQDAYQVQFPEMVAELEKSQQHLSQLAIKEAMTESFRLGSSAIHMLIKDPLLPEQLCNTANRALLSQTMLDYNQAGRKIWLQHIETLFQRK